MTLFQLQSLIEPHLEKIEDVLPPEYKLTLIARHTDPEKFKDADIILTLDSLPSVIETIRRISASEQREWKLCGANRCGYEATKRIVRQINIFPSTGECGREANKKGIT